MIGTLFRSLSRVAERLISEEGPTRTGNEKSGLRAARKKRILNTNLDANSILTLTPVSGISEFAYECHENGTRVVTC